MAGRASGLGPNSRFPPLNERPGPHLFSQGVTNCDRHPAPRQDGEISRKHGNTLIRTLRKTYGSDFAKGCADDEKLSDILATLDEQTLSRLIRDHEAGKLEQICRD
jgi:hypothetical protein